LGDSAGVVHAALGGCRRSEAGVWRWIMRPRKQAIGRWFPYPACRREQGADDGVQNRVRAYAACMPKHPAS
ncbi:MAG: hypothetical protein M3065_09945, partial [Actinomycetota bacterium]|nr:hypothetical protein [Actinomycetota bacterium]